MSTLMGETFKERALPWMLHSPIDRDVYLYCSLSECLAKVLIRLILRTFQSGYILRIIIKILVWLCISIHGDFIHPSISWCTRPFLKVHLWLWVLLESSLMAMSTSNKNECVVLHSQTAQIPVCPLGCVQARLYVYRIMCCIASLLTFLILLMAIKSWPGLRNFVLCDTRAELLQCRMHKDAVYNKRVDLVVCDEAHTLKNGDSQITTAVAGLPAVRRLLLSGTPVQVSSLFLTKQGAIPSSCTLI